MTTNEQQVTEWHRDPPAWASKFDARDWNTALRIAEELDVLAAPEVTLCEQAPEDFYCVLPGGHDGACTTYRLDGDD